MLDTFYRTHSPNIDILNIPHLNKPLSATALFLAVLLLNSCQLTPAQRIEEEPHRYATVEEQYKPLARAGEICKGMNKNAVYLAWGKPNRVDIVLLPNADANSTWSYSRRVSKPNSADEPKYRRDFDRIFKLRFKRDFELKHKQNGNYNEYYQLNYERKLKYHYKNNYDNDYKYYITETVSIREVYATVNFTNGKVISWKK